MSERTKQDDQSSDPTPKRRLERFDRILLGTLCPMFVVCFGLHVYAVASDTLLYHSFYTSSAATADDFPTVEGFILELENLGELEVGDRILNIGGVDTRGASALEASALTFTRARDGKVKMEIERGDDHRDVPLTLVRSEIPWFRIPLLLGFAGVAVLVLLRSPGSGPTRLMFAAFMELAIFQSVFTGTSAFHFYAGVFMFHVAGVVSIFTMYTWVTMFPPGLDRRIRVRRRWALLPSALWALPRFTQYLGSPLPLSSVSLQMFVVDAFLMVWILSVLSWNYLHAKPVGRRQIKVILLGVYLGLLPYIFMGVLVAIAPNVSKLSWLHPLVVGFVVVAPVAVLISIARYNLFDIDRLISGTVSYTVALVLISLLGETVFEPFAGAMGTRMGFDPSSSQLVFVGLMAAIVIPIQRVWRPFVDRLFFSRGYSNTREIERLLEELPSVEDAGPDAMLDLLGKRLHSVFGPTSCIAYQLLGESFAPVFVAGPVEAPALSGENTEAITRALSHRIGPVRLDSRGRAREDPTVTGGIRAALDGLEVALVIPLRPHGALGAFFCLGPKTSGDVYTPTDLSLLATLAHHASMELSLHSDG